MCVVGVAAYRVLFWSDVFVACAADVGVCVGERSGVPLNVARQEKQHCQPPGEHWRPACRKPWSGTWVWGFDRICLPMFGEGRPTACRLGPWVLGSLGQKMYSSSSSNASSILDCRYYSRMDVLVGSTLRS